jgi:AraC-like DNA-binding protein
MRTVEASRGLLVADVLSGLDETFTGEHLFDQLRDIVFFIKNASGQYIVVNQTLAERCGFASKSSLIGKTPTEVYRPPLGERFEIQDGEVLTTGQPLLMQLELHFYPSRDVGWCLTTKLPLRTSQGTIKGLVGVSQDLRIPDADSEDYQHLSSAITYAMAHLDHPLSVPDLAKIAGMSRYQFDRRMIRAFGLNTSQWLIKARMDAAQALLRDSSRSITSIAQNVGYSDHSSFSRQFRQSIGLSPREFRLT